MRHNETIVAELQQTSTIATDNQYTGRCIRNLYEPSDAKREECERPFFRPRRCMLLKRAATAKRLMRFKRVLLVLFLLALLLLAARGCFAGLFLVHLELGIALLLVPLETCEIWLF